MRGRPPASPSMGISQQGGYDGYSGPGQQHMRSVVTNKPGVGGEDAILITPLLSDDRTQPPKQQTSFPRAVFLLMNAILGSGILGQPYAASQSGLALFAVLLACMAVCADYAIWLLLQCCDICDVTKYESIGQHAFGKRGRQLTASIILLQNSGAITSYLVILGSLLPPLVEDVLSHLHVEHLSPWDDRTFLMITVTVLVVLPLASARHLGFLGYSSGVSITIMCFFTFVLCLRSFNVDTCPPTGGPGAAAATASAMASSLHNATAVGTAAGVSGAASVWAAGVTAVSGWLGAATPDAGSTAALAAAAQAAAEYPKCAVRAVHLDIDTFYVLPTLAFSFVCHTSLLPIYTELKQRSSRRMMLVSHTSVAICFVLYLICGIFGVLAFRGYVSGDVLSSLQAYFPSDGLVLAARVLVCLSVTVTVPLINYPARVSLTQLFFHNTATTFSWPRHIALALLVIGTLLCLALVVPTIEAVFGAVGATTSVSLVFVLPGLFYARLAPGPMVSRSKALPLAFAAMGVLIGITCLSGIVLGWFDNGFGG